MIDLASPVSVVIPVFDGERFLPEALRSVAGQTLAPREVIVVDDGSGDRSAAVAEAFSADITCLRQANCGVAGARNRGLAAATGEFVAFLDQDDLWPPDRLELTVAAFAGRPDVDIVTGRVEVIGDAITGRPWTAPGSGDQRYCANLGALLIRRAALTTLGGLDERVGVADDAEWFMRAREHGLQRLRLDAVTLRYRWHGQNASRDIDTTAADLLSALKGSIDRRRAGGPA
jgi:glycosyltransferase involved in cell wall biosynthesis